MEILIYFQFYELIALLVKDCIELQVNNISYVKIFLSLNLMQFHHVFLFLSLLSNSLSLPVCFFVSYLWFLHYSIFKINVSVYAHVGHNLWRQKDDVGAFNDEDTAFVSCHVSTENQNLVCC